MNDHQTRGSHADHTRALRSLAAILLPCIVLLAGCLGGSESAGNEALERVRIRQADSTLMSMEEQRNLDGVMQFVAPQAVFQPPGLQPIVGRDAIEQFYTQQWFSLPYVRITGRPSTIVIAESLDLAFIDGRSQLVFEVSGESFASEGKYLGVWQKLGGAWKLAAISWTANETTR